MFSFLLRNKAKIQKAFKIITFIVVAVAEAVAAILEHCEKTHSEGTEQPNC